MWSDSAKRVGCDSSCYKGELTEDPSKLKRAVQLRRMDREDASLRACDHACVSEHSTAEKTRSADCHFVTRPRGLRTIYIPPFHDVTRGMRFGPAFHYPRSCKEIAAYRNVLSLNLGELEGE